MLWRFLSASLHRASSDASGGFCVLHFPQLSQKWGFFDRIYYKPIHSVYSNVIQLIVNKSAICLQVSCVFTSQLCVYMSVPLLTHQLFPNKSAVCVQINSFSTNSCLSVWWQNYSAIQRLRSKETIVTSHYRTRDTYSHAEIVFYSHGSLRPVSI